MDIIKKETYSSDFVSQLDGVAKQMTNFFFFFPSSELKGKGWRERLGKQDE